jgi:dipeptidyl aminopeptidase/acylaminoacyl peptidase
VTVKTRACFGIFLFFIYCIPQALAQPPQTLAESSDYRATTPHAQVLACCDQLAKASPLVRLAELGTSQEGRKIPLVIIADPPIATPEEAARSDKLVAFAMANIHAGEVDGKEALLMLARDFALAKERALLKDLILILAPNFNPDGGEKLGKYRPKQAGPELVGTRANAQGFDLNRDFVKLESPEVRSLVRFFNRWDPAIVIDCHTTNGSYHRYTLTYEGGRCPAGDARLIGYVRDQLLPDVSRRLEKHSGFKSFFYGNFSADRTRWETVPPTPRYGTHYVGLRNRIAILSESYSYAPFKDRVLASKAFVQSIFEYAAKNKEQIRSLLSSVRRDTVSVGKKPLEKDVVVLRQKPKLHGRPVNILGYVEEKKDGRRVPTDRPHSYEALYMGECEPALSIRRPYAYLFPASLENVRETLQRHGIEVEELREDIELDVEIHAVIRMVRGKLFQKHRPASLETTLRAESRRVPAGTILVRTAQALGSLAAYLLEPQADDGLAAWNFFDAALEEGKDFPVLRLPAPAAIVSGRVRPLAQDRKMNRPITFETLYGKKRPNFAGNPVAGLTWIDGEHFLQVKEGRLRKVNAQSGRSQPFFDPARLAAGLATLPTIHRDAADALARSYFLHMNPQRTAALFHHDDDLYYCKLDGSGAVRLTHEPGRAELASFSPDGRFVAFVRGYNLHVVDIATQTDRALTTDGSELIRNGKADWVYFEEIFDRSWHAYWWSPDSSHIAFFRFDDSAVATFPVVNPVEKRPVPELTPYPKAGAANPRVKLGIVSVGGAAPHWADLGDYSETARILTRAGWLPDSTKVYLYVQDRAQTWLDFCTISVNGGAPVRLFRETTKAWVDDPGPPSFLKDGSFLFFSERTGWKHLYHFAADGKVKGPITSGSWEARKLHHVDEAGGWVYFSGTRDSHIANNLYRVKLDGTDCQRLTTAAGDHRSSVAPQGKLFIDTHSDHRVPAQVRLCQTDGTLARLLDTNPVYAVEEYRRGAYELAQIPLPDGFVLEGSLLKPPDFDAGRKYPVWFMTYAGPHAPTIHDSWGNGRLRDEMLAQLGFIVFRCDPRSASGKGACSTWTAYRQLGRQELRDIEDALGWLAKRPYIDAKRIGMSGGSYGGFMTAYALTHSKLLAAGIAAAPVTDWHNYDSIYTERYMNTPQENPEGYKQTSVVAAAGHLHGKLLLVHGLMDDNVHAQNSFQLVEALQRAGKEFEFMVYPRSRHGVGGRHFERLAIDFMTRALRPGK